MIMVEVTQEDREAAAKFPYIPEQIALIEAFARHRIAAEQRSKIEGVFTVPLEDGSEYEVTVKRKTD